MSALLLIAVIYGLPLALVALPVALYTEWQVVVATAFIGPVTYATLLVVTAGILSRPFQKHIVAGKFRRDVAHPVYRGRRLYGLCWASVYYVKPVYYLTLTIPVLKWLTFRLFGYHGQMDFTLYPDTWIRDLPLLDFGRQAYIAHRATLGTNMVLSNGRILVDGIRVGRFATVGHLATLAPGAVIGDRAEIGAGCAIGARVKVESDALVQPSAALNHMVHVGHGAVIRWRSYVGARFRVARGTQVPAGTVVGQRGIARTPAEADPAQSAGLDVRRGVEVGASTQTVRR